MASKRVKAPERLWIAESRDHIHSQEQVNCPCGQREYIRADLVAAAIATERGQVWKEAIQIVAKQKCEEQFSEHWQNGFSLAQFLSIEALDAAKAKDTAAIRNQEKQK